MPENGTHPLLQACITAYREGQYEAAVAACRQVVDEAPYLFDAYFYLAAGLSGLGRSAEAVDVMQDAQRVHPASAAVDYNLAELARQMGREEEARAYYESALQKADSDTALDDPEALRRRIRRKLAALG